MANTIKIDTTFYCKSVRKEEYRDPSVGIENSMSFCFIDNAKKDKKDNDWGPYDAVSINLMNSKNPPAIQFGKKYKITIEEVE